MSPGTVVRVARLDASDGRHLAAYLNAVGTVTRGEVQLARKTEAA